MQKNIRDGSLLYIFYTNQVEQFLPLRKVIQHPPLLLLAPLLTNSTILSHQVLSHSYGRHGSTRLHRRKLNYSPLKLFSELLKSYTYFKVSQKPAYVNFLLPNIENNQGFQIEFSHQKIKEQSKFFQHLSSPHCINVKLTKKCQLTKSQSEVHSETSSKPSVVYSQDLSCFIEYAEKY